MHDLIEFSSPWNQVTALLEDGQSLVIIAPRNYGKWAVLEKYAKRMIENPDCRPVFLSSRFPLLSGNMVYPWVWDDIRRQLGWKKKPKVTDRASFLMAFEAAVRAIHSQIIIFIGGAGRGHEESHFQVLSLFQSVLSLDNLSIVSIDDYSSFYFQKPGYVLSDLHSFIKIQIGPTNVKEITSFINDRCHQTLPLEYAARVAEIVHKHSGGHTGLAQELINGIHNESWPNDNEQLNACIQNALKRSVVLETITQILEEDAGGYSHTALEYRSPATPKENSPRIHVLRQLGVLLREDPPKVHLCSGAITRLVERLAHIDVTSTQRIGTIISESGPRIFEAGQIDLNDDDLVIVHISDLHVGEHYRYRLVWNGGQWNPNEQSAAELLRDDLQSLGLLGRVDAMVLSGDFVWTGAANEFRRARTAIEEILLEVRLGVEHVLFIPGNHDMEWNPGNLAAKDSGKPVSRESYNEFLELLTKKSGDALDVLTVHSRSKGSELRILGLDSNRVEGPDAAGIGFVSRDSLLAAKKNLAGLCVDDHKQRLVWMVLHHHVFPATSTPLQDAAGRSISVLANAADLLGFANEWKLEVILHGHEHQPCITVAKRWPIDAGEAFAPIVSIGAGSFGAKREYLGPFSRNHYYVIVRRSNGILIRSRQQGSTGVKFVAHSDIWLPR